jgi:uncharacterized protein YndB with AHSA1/START domain
MTTEPHATVRVTRRFNASPERVFDGWLHPDKVRRWMAEGSDEVVRVDVDPRVGGVFAFVVRRQGEEIEHVGEYLEVARPRRLVFTWSAPRLSKETIIVSIDIAPAGTGAELTLTNERVPEGYETRAEAGWTKILAALDLAMEPQLVADVHR